MNISNRLYDILKYVCTIALPAIGAFIGIIFPAVGVADNITTIVLTCIGATATLIGALIGVSSASYKKRMADKGTIIFLNNEDEGD